MECSGGNSRQPKTGSDLVLIGPLFSVGGKSHINPVIPLTLSRKLTSHFVSKLRETVLSRII